MYKRQHDGVVAKRILNDLDTLQQPFYINWLTLSSHEPFETPVNTVIEGSSTEAKFLNSHNYSDAVIQNFVEACKQKPWWENTIIIITGDHGHPLPFSTLKSENFRVPVLFTGGAVKRTGRYGYIKSQMDIFPELLLQLNIPFEEDNFGKSLTGKQNQWAYYAFNNGFGFISNSGKQVFDNVGNISIESNGEIITNERLGKALQRWSLIKMRKL